MATDATIHKEVKRSPNVFEKGWSYLADHKARWLFVTPSMLILIVLVAYPTYYLIRLSLSRYDMAFMDQPVFIGFGNFVKLFSDHNFLVAVKNTFMISIGAVLIEFLLGLGLALLVFEPLRGSYLLKVLLIIPLMIPPVVSGLNFRLILDTFGPLNGILSIFGLPAVNWVGVPNLARMAVILTDVWQWTPFIFVIILAALNAIPGQLIDAARVDGANDWKLFRHIIWPMIIPAIAVALTFRFIDALKLFDIVYMETFGGPGDATQVVSLYVYRTAFRFGKLGYASTMGVVILIFSTLVVWGVLRVLRVERRLGWEENK